MVALSQKSFLFLFSGITVIFVFLDQFCKYLIQHFHLDYSLFYLHIHYITNTGAGFGIFKEQTIWLALISLVVAGVIIIYYPKIPKEKAAQILFALFLGGVLGNLIDRLFRGYVIDFIDFKFWPAFNLADSVITIAVIGLIVYYWKE